MFLYFLSYSYIFGFITLSNALPDEGISNYKVTGFESSVVTAKSLFKGSQIYIKVNCETKNNQHPPIQIGWVVIQSPCWDSSNTAAEGQKLLETNKTLTKAYNCNDNINLEESELSKNENLHSEGTPVKIVERDGVYVLVLLARSTISEFNLSVLVRIRSSYGYLSAADWPLLPFYGIMCFIYVIYGIGWLLVSFLQWRDLLRVQFWIGAVILLGMLEKATFYAEYQNINYTGTCMQGAMLLAEWVSCAKRTLARMLVIIVSLGFGIVKPRLGSALHRVIGVGVLYFILAATESYLRVMKSSNNQNKDLYVASVPLAVLDSAICWWIFTALVNTTRTLSLRRNEVKLALYRHFTNTLIFSVVASIIFMLYSIKTHRIVSCLTTWKDLWLEDAYWHILFSLVLLIIMILWRPTNNNQRYAFVPLLETGDDEEEEHLVNDAYGVKVRIHQQQKLSSPKTTSIEDEIKWLEENVKSELPLPILDSDEELVNTHFEVSKMQ